MLHGATPSEVVGAIKLRSDGQRARFFAQMNVIDGISIRIRSCVTRSHGNWLQLVETRAWKCEKTEEKWKRRRTQKIAQKGTQFKGKGKQRKKELQAEEWRREEKASRWSINVGIIATESYQTFLFLREKSLIPYYEERKWSNVFSLIVKSV